MRALRDEGIDADIDLMSRNPGKNMKYAESMGFRYVALLGAKELEKGVVSLKNMGSGEQNELSFQELIELLRNFDISRL